MFSGFVVIAAMACCNWLVTPHTADMALTTQDCSSLVMVWASIFMVISAMDAAVRRLSIVRGNCGMTIFLIGACNPLMIMAVRQSSGMVESVASFWILEMYWSADSAFCCVMSTNPKLNGICDRKRSRKAVLRVSKDDVTSGVKVKNQSQAVSFK